MVLETGYVLTVSIRHLMHSGVNVLPNSSDGCVNLIQKIPFLSQDLNPVHL